MALAPIRKHVHDEDNWTYVVKASDRERVYAERIYEAMRSMEGFSTRRWLRLYEEEGEAAAYAAIPQEAFEAAIIDSSDRYLTAALTQEGGDESARLGMSFDTTNYRVFDWISQNTGNLIVEIDSSQRTAIQNIIARAALAGGNPRDIAVAVRNVVGLHDRWATAVFNYDQKLLGDGVSYANRQALVGAYHDKLLRARALNIARTETMRAQNQGRLQAWFQAADAGLFDSSTTYKQWSTAAARVCPYCAPMDGVRVKWDETFSTALGSVDMPPLHPSCRCTAFLVIAKDEEEMEQQTEAERSLAESIGLHGAAAGAAALFVASPADDLLILAALEAMRRIGADELVRWVYTKMPWGRTMPLAQVYDFPVKDVAAQVGFARVLYREIASHTDEKRFLQRTFAKGPQDRKRYTHEERRLVEDFRGGGGNVVNQVLRKGNHAVDDRLYTRQEIEPVALRLDALIAKGEPLPEPIRLFHVAVIDEDALRLGDTFTDSGFNYGVLRREHAEMMVQRELNAGRAAYLIEIEVPAGTRVQWAAVTDDAMREFIEEGLPGQALMLERNLDLRVARIYDEDGVRHVVLKLHDPADLQLPLDGLLLVGEARELPAHIGEVLDGTDAFMRRISHPDWYHSRGFTIEEILAEDLIGLRRGSPTLRGVARYEVGGSTIGLTRQTAERIALFFDMARNGRLGVLHEDTRLFNELVGAMRVMLHEALHMTGSDRARMTRIGARALEEATTELLARDLVPHYLRYMGIEDVDSLPWGDVRWTTGYGIYIQGVQTLAERISALDPLLAMWRWTRTEGDYDRRIALITDDLLASIGINRADVTDELAGQVRGLVDRYFKRLEGFQREIAGWETVDQFAWHERQVTGLLTDIEEAVVGSRPPPDLPPGAPAVVGLPPPPIIEELPVEGRVIPLRPVAEVPEIPGVPEPPLSDLKPAGEGDEPVEWVSELLDTDDPLVSAWDDMENVRRELARIFTRRAELDHIPMNYGFPDSSAYDDLFGEEAIDGLITAGSRWTGLGSENRAIQAVLNGRRIDDDDVDRLLRLTDVETFGIPDDLPHQEQAVLLVRRWIEQMDTAFADPASGAPVDFITYRGAWLDEADLRIAMDGNLDNIEALIGRVRWERGYQSTTFSRNMAEWFLAQRRALEHLKDRRVMPVMFRIRVRQGQKVLWVNNDVAETLIDRGSGLRIVGARYDTQISPEIPAGRMLILDAEIELPDEVPAIRIGGIELPGKRPIDPVTGLPIIEEPMGFDLKQWYAQHYPNGLPKVFEPTEAEVRTVVNEITRRAAKLPEATVQNSPGLAAVASGGGAVTGVPGDTAGVMKVVVKVLDDFAERYPSAARSILELGHMPGVGVRGVMATRSIGTSSSIFFRDDVGDVAAQVREWYRLWGRYPNRVPAGFDPGSIYEYFIAHELGHVLYNYAARFDVERNTRRLVDFLRNYTVQFARADEMDFARNEIMLQRILSRELSSYPAQAENQTVVWTEVVAESYAEVYLAARAGREARPFARGVVLWIEGLIESEEAREQAPTLARKLLDEGGFSARFLTGEEPQRGYMVGLARTAGHEDPFDITGMSPEEVALRVLDFQLQRAALLRNEGYYVGGWVDEGRAVLDVSVNVVDRSDAIRRGIAAEQDAIYDLASGESIVVRRYVSGDGTINYVTDPEVAQIRRSLGLSDDTGTLADEIPVSEDQLHLFDLPEPSVPFDDRTALRGQLVADMAKHDAIEEIDALIDAIESADQLNPEDADYIVSGLIGNRTVLEEAADMATYEQTRPSEVEWLEGWLNTTRVAEVIYDDPDPFLSFWFATNVDEETMQALSFYRHPDGYWRINQYFRTGVADDGDYYPDGFVEAKAEQLRWLLTETAEQTPQDLITYRTSFMPMWSDNIDPKSLIGKPYTEDGVMSTSLSRRSAEMFADRRLTQRTGGPRTLFEVQIPNGTIVQVGDPSVAEIMLAPGTQFTVVNAWWESSFWSAERQLHVVLRVAS